MKDRDFVLIGVNSDDLEKAQEAVEKNELNWRSFQDAQPGGKISKTWGISGWPTIIVIDTDMKIVYRGHDGHWATALAKQLVEEASSED
jgi:peroxiredoxin